MIQKFQTTSPQNSRPVHGILKGKPTNASKYLARRITVLVTVLVTLLFISKIILGFFNVENVSLTLSGNVHYTAGQIYDVLGANLHNIITDSETRAAEYLQENLSYVKAARISKNLAKRQLNIEITERNRFARLAYVQQQVGASSRARQRSTHFFLIDGEGYVLESIASDKFQDRFPLIQDEGKAVPEIGERIELGATQLSLRVLHIMMLQEPELLIEVKQIDARIPQKIEIQVDSLAIPVWIAADLIETGVRHIAIFVKHRARLLLQNVGPVEQRDTASGGANSPSRFNEEQREIGIRQTPLQAAENAPQGKRSNFTGDTAPSPQAGAYKYLDARYEDTLYLGGENR